MARETITLREEIVALRDSLGAAAAEVEARLRSTLDGKVEQLHRIADLRHFIADHPWPALFLAIAVGFLLGRR